MPRAQLSPKEQARRRVLIATPAQVVEVGRLVRRQIAEAAAMTDAATAAMLPVLHQAMRELKSELPKWTATRPDGDVRWTAQAYRVALAQISAMTETLERKMGIVLDKGATHAQRMAIRHSREEIGRFSQLFDGTTRSVPLDIARQIATGRSYIIPRIHTSSARYAGDVGTDIRQRLAVDVLKGSSVFDTIQRLREHGGPRGTVALRGVMGDASAIVEEIPEGLFARYGYWAERVVRTELISAYNTQLAEVREEAAQSIPGLRKKWNGEGGACPSICAPLADVVVDLDEQFPGGYDHAPAHPNCRCRTGTWKDTWPSERLTPQEGVRSEMDPPGGIPGQPPPWFTDDVSRPRGTFTLHPQGSRIESAERATIERLVREGNHVVQRPHPTTGRGADHDVYQLAGRTPSERTHVEIKNLGPDATPNTIKYRLSDSLARGGQGRNLVFDVSASGMTREAALEGYRSAVKYSTRRMSYMRLIGADFDLTLTPHG